MENITRSEKLDVAVVGSIFANFYGVPSFADSVLTEVKFYQDYLDIPEVQSASVHREITPEHIAFLVGERPLDEKLAVANALGWHPDGTNHGGDLELLVWELERRLLEAPDVKVVLGYLRAMDNYRFPESALPLVTEALEDPRIGSKQSASVILGMIHAQTKRYYSEIWDAFSHFALADGLVKDMRPEAFERIVAYVKRYR